MQLDFAQRLEEIIRQDGRYKIDAYDFIMQALLFTQKKLKRKGHVTARELLKGAKEWALEQYGPLARTVLAHWGINKTEDFGRVVFNMIDKGLLGKRQEDTLEDFSDVYDFDEAFDLFGVRNGKSKKALVLRSVRKRARKEKPYEKIT